MKKIILLLIFSFSAHAENEFVKMNINTGMSINGAYHYKDSGVLGTGIGSKEHVGTVSATLRSYFANGVYTENKELDYNVEGDVISGQCKDDELARVEAQKKAYEKCLVDERNMHVSHYGNQTCAKSNEEEIAMETMRMKYGMPFNRKLRDTKFHLRFQKNDNITLVSIDVADKQENKSDSFGSYSVKYHNDFITGTIDIGTKIPDNTWAVLVHRKKMDGIFSGQLPNAKASPGLVHSLNQSLDFNGLDQFIAWGKPGTEVSHQIVFDKYSQGSNVSGSIEIEFKPIDFSDTQSLSPENLVGQILNTTKNYKNISNFDDLLKQIKPILYMHGNSNIRKKIISSFSTVTIIQLIDSLTNVAYSAEANPYHWDLKAASTILAYELAYDFLGGLTAFCVPVHVVLPFSKTNITTVGLRMASYYMDRAKARLEHNTFKYFEALAQHLKGYEDRNLKYSDVRNNPEEFQHLRDAVKLLTGTVNMRDSTFESTYVDIHSVMEKYGTLGAPGSESKDIIDFVSSVRGADVAFYNLLLNRLRLFQPDNTSKVVAKDIVLQLHKLESDQNKIFKMLNDEVKISNSGEESTNQNLTQNMIAMISHNLNIFNKEFEYKSFEDFRKSYVDIKRLNVLTLKLRPCLEKK